MFANFKVGTKLGLGFGLVIVLMAVVSAIGISRMARIDESVEMAANDRWPKTVQLNQIVFESSQIGIALRNMMLTTSRDDLAQQKERVLEGRKTIGAAVDKLDAMIALPKGKELLAQLREHRQQYIAGQEHLMQLVEDNKADEARAYLQNELRGILKGYQDQAVAFAKFQGDLMEGAAQEAQETYTAGRNLMLALVAVAIAVGSILAVWITRGILRQLGGEPDYAAEIARKVAAGDLTQRIELSGRDKSSLLAAMREMVERLGATIADVCSAADNLSSAAEQVSATSQSLSQAASEQAASIEETSSSMEQMSASINQNTENAKVTNGIADKSAREAIEGGEAVRATVSAMKAIADKIGIIDDIAYQTNLLALNAAIEAARAGEHGKGFAVVAAEVRKLAERSQVAAQEIGELAGSSVKTSETAGRLLDEMVPSIRRTAELVQEITASSQEQAVGASQINAAMGQLSQTTQQNASASEELSATAEEMSGQAEQLQHLMGFFQLASGQGRAAGAAVARSGPRSQPARKGAKNVLSRAAAALPAAAELGGDPEYVPF